MTDLPNLPELLKDPEKAIKKLPESVREEYERAQQSVIDARREANQVEGRLWITH